MKMKEIENFNTLSAISESDTREELRAKIGIELQDILNDTKLPEYIDDAIHKQAYGDHSAIQAVNIVQKYLDAAQRYLKQLKKIQKSYDKKK